jgi:hypothetical protein
MAISSDVAAFSHDWPAGVKAAAPERQDGRRSIMMTFRKSRNTGGLPAG